LGEFLKMLMDSIVDPKWKIKIKQQMGQIFGDVNKSTHLPPEVLTPGGRL